MGIKIEFEGVIYVVPREAYNGGLVQLPDGRLLKIDGWFETDPPQPCEISIVEVHKAQAS